MRLYLLLPLLPLALAGCVVAGPPRVVERDRPVVVERPMEPVVVERPTYIRPY
jgi:hypothetical protein